MSHSVSDLQHVRRFFELSSEYLVVARLDGVILHVNPACVKSSGFEEGELVGRPFHIFLHPDDVRGGLERLERLCKGEDIGWVVSRYRTRSGEWRWIEWNSCADMESRVIYCIGRDVTARCQAERESDLFFVLSNDLLCIVDLEGRVRRINPAFERALGYSILDLKGRHLKDFIHPEDLEATDAACKRMAKDCSLNSFENRYLCRDGSVKWLQWSAIAYPEEDLIYASARDVTQWKLHERALERNARELQRSNADLQQFVYTASHDLQEPLRMVASYTELLSQRYSDRLDENGLLYLAYAHEGAIRMHRLLLDLLAYAQVANEAARDEEVSCDEAFDLAARNLGEAGADIQRGDLPVVRGSHTELVFLFQNLLSNAVKFRGEHRPEVGCAARRVDDEWMFSVEDNGIGIEPAHFDRIFALFQRLHRRDVYPGTGLGLAICRKIVTSHGGRIWVTSAPGKGSTFWFTLPA